MPTLQAEDVILDVKGNTLRAYDVIIDVRGATAMPWPLSQFFCVHICTFAAATHIYELPFL